MTTKPNKAYIWTAEEIELLLSAARAVARVEPFDKTAQTIFDICKKLTGAQSGYIALLSADGTTNELLFLDSGGLPCSVDPSLPMPIRGLRAEAYKTTQPVFCNNFMQSHHVVFLPAGHVVLKNVLFAPLVVEGKAIGLIGLANKPADFNEQDVHRVMAFSDLLAVALLNSNTLKQLVTLKEYYRIISEISTDVVLVLCSEYRVQDAFGNTTSLFGRHPEELRGVPLSEILQDDNVECMLHSLVPDGSCERREFHINTGNHAIKVIETTFSNWLKHPSVNGIIMLCKDITEHKKTEEYIMHAQKTEAIRTIVGGFAHNFNNILAGIVGYGELVKSELEADSPLKPHLENMLKQCDRARSLIHQLVALTHFTEHQLTRINVKPILQDYLAKVRPTIPPSLEVVFDARIDDAPVLATPDQIQQIIMHVFANAIEAIGEKAGTVTITVKETELQETTLTFDFILAPGTYIHLSVADTGCGMSSSLLAKIFDPFFTTKEPGRALGLGLSVVHSIVQQLDGGIVVETEIAKGSTFHILLPRYDGDNKFTKHASWITRPALHYCAHRSRHSNASY